MASVTLYEVRWEGVEDGHGLMILATEWNERDKEFTRRIGKTALGRAQYVRLPKTQMGMLARTPEEAIQKWRLKLTHDLSVAQRQTLQCTDGLALLEAFAHAPRVIQERKMERKGEP